MQSLLQFGFEDQQLIHWKARERHIIHFIGNWADIDVSVWHPIDVPQCPRPIPQAYTGNSSKLDRIWISSVIYFSSKSHVFFFFFMPWGFRAKAPHNPDDKVVSDRVYWNVVSKNTFSVYQILDSFKTDLQEVLLPLFFSLHLWYVAPSSALYEKDQ